jgi:hypothetical protein
VTNCPPAAPPANPENTAEQPLSPKPESGLEPLTYRLQGDTTVRLNTPILPAKWYLAAKVRRSRLSADFG